MPTDSPNRNVPASEAMAVDHSRAETLARELFGLCGRATRLNGERDSNFLLTDERSQRYVIKIGRPGEDPKIAIGQSAALRQLSRIDPTLPVPRVVEALDGSLVASVSGPGGNLCARVLTFLEGVPIHLTQNTPAQRRHLGHVLARLDSALRDVEGAVDDHALLWDLQRATQVRHLVEELPAGCDKSLVRRFLDAFATHAAPILPELRRQFIHNDANPQNLLVDARDHERIVGVIDFGDMVWAPLVQELAVGAAYHVRGAGHPLEGITDLVGGFHATTHLLPDEIDVLYDLIAVRLVLIVVIGNWRARREPNNSAYVLRNSEAAWGGLKQLATISRDDARAYFAAHCLEGGRE